MTRLQFDRAQVALAWSLALVGMSWGLPCSAQQGLGDPARKLGGLHVAAPTFVPGAHALAWMEYFPNGGTARRIRIVDLDNGQETVLNLGGMVGPLAFSADGRLLATGFSAAQAGGGATTGVVSFPEGRLLATMQARGATLGFAADGRVLIFDPVQRALIACDATTGQALQSVPVAPAPSRSRFGLAADAMLAPDRQTVVLVVPASSNEQLPAHISFWDAVALTAKGYVADPRLTPAGIGPFSPDGARMATRWKLDGKNCTEVWDVRGAKCESVFAMEGRGWPSSWTFTPAGSALAGVYSGEVRYHDARTGAQIGALPYKDAKDITAAHVLFSPDGAWLVLSGHRPDIHEKLNPKTHGGVSSRITDMSGASLLWAWQVGK